jgi:hypothetical protein
MRIEGDDAEDYERAGQRGDLPMTRDDSVEAP